MAFKCFEQLQVIAMTFEAICARALILVKIWVLAFVLSSHLCFKTSKLSCEGRLYLRSIQLQDRPLPSQDVTFYLSDRYHIRSLYI